MSRVPPSPSPANGTAHRADRPFIAFTDEQRNRYARHLSLPEIDAAGQLKLLNGKVLIIGAGGLGAPVALYLAAAGVGTIGISEFDNVESSNLQRQVIYTTDDVGQPKLDVAEKRLHALNPDVKIVRHPGRLDSSNALDTLASYDVIINGTDNFPTRYLVNDACVLLKKINVDGSIFRFEGLNTVFAPHLREFAGRPVSTGCYRCQYPEPPPPGMVPSCAEGGVMGSMCGIVGSVQATEAIKILAEIGTPLFGRLQVLNALDMHIRTLKLRRDPQCPVCGDHATITKLIDYQEFCGLPAANASKPVVTHRGVQLNVNPAWEVHPAEVAARLTRKDTMLILDVRLMKEYKICRINGSTLIPLNELTERAEGELAGWQNRPVIVYCHHGVRSMTATAILRRMGFADVHSMAGGIEAWSLIVDGNVPRY